MKNYRSGFFFLNDLIGWLKLSVGRRLDRNWWCQWKRKLVLETAFLFSFLERLWRVVTQSNRSAFPTHADTSSIPRGGKHPCSRRCQRADPQFIHLCFEDLLSHSGPLSKTCDLYHHDSGCNLNRGLAGSIWRESELTVSADRIPARWETSLSFSLKPSPRRLKRPDRHCIEIIEMTEWIVGQRLCASCGECWESVRKVKCLLSHSTTENRLRKQIYPLHALYFPCW